MKPTQHPKSVPFRAAVVATVLPFTLDCAPAGELHLRLVDEREQPVANARFHLKVASHPFKPVASKRHAPAKKGRDGAAYHYTLESSGGFSGTLKIAAPGYAVHEQAIQWPRTEEFRTIYLKPLRSEDEAEHPTPPPAGGYLAGKEVLIYYETQEALARKVAAACREAGGEVQVKQMGMQKANRHYRRKLLIKEEAIATQLFKAVPELRDFVLTPEAAASQLVIGLW